MSDRTGAEDRLVPIIMPAAMLTCEGLPGSIHAAKVAEPSVLSAYRCQGMSILLKRSRATHTTTKTTVYTLTPQ